MGPQGDSIVDLQLGVYGIGTFGCRCAAKPTVPVGNTIAPTIMIAEKVADMILEDAGRDHESARCTLQNSANGPFTWPRMSDRNAVGWKICPSGM